MKILFFCPRWGCETQSWNSFFSAVKAAGYDGVEMGFPFTLARDEKEEILTGLNEYHLAVIGQHWQTTESDFNKHRNVFKKHLYSLIELRPLFINSQTGKDYFTIEQNLALMQTANEISEKPLPSCTKHTGANGRLRRTSQNSI